MQRGEWHVSLDQEDGQTALENLLTARIGESGGRLHLGRSRNDQVLAALRLYLRDAVQSLSAGARSCGGRRSTSWPQREGKTALPGYTHMQPAMPSSVALWAGGFAAELRDDAEGLRHALRRIDKKPAWLCGRLRDAKSADRPRSDALATGFCDYPRAGDRGAAFARQGRGAGAVRDLPADAGPRPACC